MQRIRASLIATFLPGVVSLGMCTSALSAVIWDTGPGHNDHWYEAVFSSAGITWPEANSAATAVGGYLATVTAAEENSFVFNLAFNDPNPLWDGDANEATGPWLGGTDAAVEGVWQWVTSETWGPFENWALNQPNDSAGGQDFLHYYYNGGVASTWNDLQDTPTVFGYVVEWNTQPTVPIPPSIALVLFGGALLVLAKRLNAKNQTV
jgi:hypothetical protein